MSIDPPLHNDRYTPIVSGIAEGGCLSTTADLKNYSSVQYKSVILARHPRF
jgi:hypothetical protein